MDGNLIRRSGGLYEGAMALDTEGNPYSIASAKRPTAITPDADFPECRALWVGAAGDIEMVSDGVTAIVKNVPVGMWSFACTRINSAGTSASQLMALY